MVKRLSLLTGALAALSRPAHGLVFVDKIKQNIGGNTLTLLHGVSDETSVGFGIPTDPDTEADRLLQVAAAPPVLHAPLSRCFCW